LKEKENENKKNKINNLCIGTFSTHQNFYPNKSNINFNYLSFRKNGYINLNEKNLNLLTNKNHKKNFTRSNVEKIKILKEKENNFELKIDLPVLENFDSNRMILRRDELNENKYYENIKFNYIRKNFSIFKEFIEKPNEIIEIPKSNKFNSSSFKNHVNKSATKLDFLYKFKNIKIKSEILNNNFST